MVRLVWKWMQFGVTALAVTSLLFFGVGPRLLNYRTLDMLSGSMAPQFPTGSEVIDTSIPISQLRVGDVLTYHIPVFDHHVESHRIVSISPDAGGGWIVRTKGDHNNAPDPWTADITGARVWIARADLPYVGYAIHVLRSPLILRLLQWVVPGLLLLWLLRGVWTAEGAKHEVLVSAVTLESQPVDAAEQPHDAADQADVVAGTSAACEPRRKLEAPRVLPAHAAAASALPERRGARRWVAPVVFFICVPLGLWSTRTVLRADGKI